MDYITKDSGKRIDYETGARRDTEDGKPRYDLIDVTMLKRLAELMARGAEKYGDHNWKLGIPSERFLSSGLRHFYQYIEGDKTEDHLAAVIFNVMGIMYNEAQQQQVNPETPDKGIKEDIANYLYFEYHANFHECTTTEELAITFEKAKYEKYIGDIEVSTIMAELYRDGYIIRSEGLLIPSSKLETLL